MKERVYELVGFVYLIGLLILVLVLFFGGNIIGYAVSSDTGVEFGVNASDDTLIDDSPVDDTPVDDTPVDDTPVDDTPVDDTPVDDTLIDDSSADDTGNDNSIIGGLEDDIKIFGASMMWLLVGLGVFILVLILIIIFVVVIKKAKKKKKNVKGVGTISAPDIVARAPVASQTLATPQFPVAPQAPVAPQFPATPQTPATPQFPVAPPAPVEANGALEYLKYYSQNVSHDPKVRIRYLINSGKKFVEANNFVVAKGIYGFIAEEYKSLGSHDESIYSEIVNFKNSIRG